MNTAKAAAQIPTSLEIIAHPSVGGAHRTPILFVHGAFVAAWCWEEHFLPWFAKRGWDVYALSLTGHGNSRGRVDLDHLSLDNYVADIAEVVATLPSSPVLVGHSMGGMVVQKYLEQAASPAVVLMASVPPQGLISSALGMLFSAPHLLFDLNSVMGGGEPGLDSLRESLFHQPVSTEKLRHYLSLSQPESHRALWDMTLYNLPHPGKAYKAPMLILGAEYDRLVPPSQVYMTANTYGTRPEIFAGMGHGMMLERGWENVAVRIEEWLCAQGL